MDKEFSYKTTALVLKWGSCLSILILISGLILFIINPSSFQFGVTSLGKNFWRNLISFDSQAIINLGILLLMLVPFFRVLAIGIGFVIEKDKKYSLISGVVLLFLILGIFLALSQV
ncbi:MAG: hypothetical protein RBG1_1C00001G1841 [candidate division Zixibacteria bacterium RBG-1]|nr:MAG: hypothetical protein RBG1_1C00001G1841 [candidate division Zixibacteria bacterium RBG-1]OGC85980.1 MAG: hypothetical protein A2V73_04055 [candidate division Zixibacteria bacterium RBG_19FT_COMBO_42_43]